MRLAAVVVASSLVLTSCASLLFSVIEHVEEGVPITSRSGVLSVTPPTDRWIRDDSQEERASFDLALLRDSGDTLLSVQVYEDSGDDVDLSGYSESGRIIPDESREELVSLEGVARSIRASGFSGRCGRLKMSFVRACELVVEVRVGDLLILFEAYASALTAGGRAARIQELGAFIGSIEVRAEPASL